MAEMENAHERASISNLIDADNSGEEHRSETNEKDIAIEDSAGNQQDQPQEPTNKPTVNEPKATEVTQNTASDAQSTHISTVNEQAAKPVPAWMKETESPRNTYDKYVPRADERRRGDPRATEQRQDLRYAKYMNQNQEERRIRRREDDDDGENKRTRTGITAQFDDRRQGVRKNDTQAEQGDPDEGSEDQNDEEQEEEPMEAQPYSRLATSVQSTQHYHTFQSHIANKENKDINSIVRSHYNQRTIQSKMQGSRTKSPIYKLRNFNNAVKYILLGNHVRRNPNAGQPTVILDMCCGKGGDLNKAEFVGADQYIGVDISDASVKEAFHRYRRNKARFIPRNGGRQAARDSRKYNFEACFATGDCFQQSIPEILEPNFPGIVNGLFPVDCVLIQFSMHYSFESEERVRTMLNNVSKSLRPGGSFVGTIPSSDFIRDKIVNKDFLPGTDNKFGNDLYSVTFHQPPPADGVFRPPFGNKYDYFLRDAVDNVPEYVVPFEVFRLMCEEYGLTLRYKKNFIDIFNQEIPKYFHKLNRNLIDGMKRADGKYGAEGAEKEAVSFYLGFAFEKLG